MREPNHIRRGCRAAGLCFGILGHATAARAVTPPPRPPPSAATAAGTATEESEQASPDDDESAKPREKEERLRAFNAIYAEALGPGGVYSFNYERRLGDEGLWGLRLGVSYISVGASNSTSSTSSSTSNASVSLLTFPITVSYLGIGSASNKFEIGGGGMIAYASASAGGVGGTFSSASGVGGAGTVLIGYRYQPNRGGFQFRIGASPLFGPGGVLPWGYLSLGGAFGS